MKYCLRDDDAPATSRLLRRMNAQRVLDALRAGGPLRVTELVARDRALAADRRRRRRRPAAARLARGVRGRGGRAAGARRAARVPGATPATSSGVDIGEVKVRAAVADLRGEVVAERVRDFAGDGPAAGDPPQRPRRRSTDAGDRARASCCRRASAAPGAMDAARGPRAVHARLPGRLRPRGRAGAHARPPGRRRERLQPRGDRRALARRGRGPRRRRLRARRRAHRRGDHGRRPADARARGRGGRARVPRRLRGRARRARHRPARARALRRGAGGGLRRRRRGRRGGARDRRARRALGRPRDRHDGADRQPRGRRDRRRRRARRRGRCSRRCGAGWRRWCGMPPRLEASPLAERGPLLGAIRLALDELEPRLLDGLDEAA